MSIDIIAVCKRIIWSVWLLAFSAMLLSACSSTPAYFEEFETERIWSREYYADALRDFLALGKQDIVVMLRDVDADGFEELVTYWQEDVPHPTNNPAVEYISELNYGLDVYDIDGGEKLHFTEEKTEQVGDDDVSSWADPYDTLFITEKGYLAFKHFWIGYPTLPGWVYDHSQKHSLKGSFNVDDLTFDDEVVTMDEFKGICTGYGLDVYEIDDVGGEFLSDLFLMTYEAGTPIFPYEDTEHVIRQILGWE
jgi:hypothetical protein